MFVDPEEVEEIVSRSQGKIPGPFGPVLVPENRFRHVHPGGSDEGGDENQVPDFQRDEGNVVDLLKVVFQPLARGRAGNTPGFVPQGRQELLSAVRLHIFPYPNLGLGLVEGGRKQTGNGEDGKKEQESRKTCDGQRPAVGF